MNYTIEQKISYAVRQRNDIALAAAVKHLPVWDRDYDEIRNVSRAPAAVGLWVRIFAWVRL